MGLSRWASQYNNQPWTLLHLKDAQWHTLIAIVVYAIAFPLLWRGFPTWYHRSKWVNYKDRDGALGGKFRKERHPDAILCCCLPISNDASYYVYAYADPRVPGDPEDKLPNIPDIGKGNLGWSQIEEEDEDDKFIMVEEVERRYWFPILWPFKMFTVDVHEWGHIIPAILAGARVLYKMIDASEGGITVFKGPPARQPSMKWILPAGYIMSCLGGCALIFAGFEDKRSKYASIALAGFAVFSISFSALVRPKFAIHYHQHWWRKHLARFFGNHGAAAEHERKQQLKEKLDREESKWREKAIPLNADSPTPHDMMVSIDTMLLFYGIIISIIGVFWWLDDSVYLRFVHLGLGVMSLEYAMGDVNLDGIIHGEDVPSDATEMAKAFNKKMFKVIVSLHIGLTLADLGSQKKQHPVGWYSNVSFAIMLLLFVGTILAGLYASKTTMAQQAYESRKFLPSPNHYGPADLWHEVKDTLSSSSTGSSGSSSRYSDVS